MGIFKRFRATVNVWNGKADDITVQSVSAPVYRQFSTDNVFSPGYRTIDEGSYSNYSTATVSTSQPKVKKELPPINIPKATVKIPPPQTGVSNGQVTVENKTPENVPKTVAASSSKPVKEEKKKGDKDKSKSKDKDKPKDKKKKDKKDKEKKVKLGADGGSKSKSKSKSDKDKKKDTSTPVASVTIDEAAVASAQGEPLAAANTIPPPSQTTQNANVKKSPVKSRNVLANPLAAQRPNTQVESTEASNTSFSSSWDQVAMHRVNLHRELKSSATQPNNLRSMMNQNKEVNDGGPANRFVPHSNSPRNVMTVTNNTAKIKYAESDGSGSEADA